MASSSRAVENVFYKIISMRGETWWINRSQIVSLQQRRDAGWTVELVGGRMLDFFSDGIDLSFQNKQLVDSIVEKVVV